MTRYYLLVAALVLLTLYLLVRGHADDFLDFEWLRDAW